MKEETIDRRPHVLIVDDNPANLLTLEASLESLDVETVPASSGEEALRKLLEHDFAVVLLDVRMPGIDGFETAELLRDRESSRSTPIIFLTAHDREHARAFRGYALGAVDYMSKPYDPEILRAKVSIFVELFRHRQEVHRKSQEMEDLNRRLRERTADLEAFSYSLSHDLRAPLRTIDGFGSLLMEAERERLGEESLAWLGKIRGASARMSELIEDMLTLAQASHTELHIRPIDLTAMIEGVLGEIRGEEQRAGVEISVDAGLTTIGDPGLFRIALLNLLENAWKFSARIEAPAIRVAGSTTESGALRLVITDNGCGFDRERAEGIFEPFRRFHKASEFSGTGIGLAIVQRVLSRHAGTIEIDSTPGEGTRVTLEIPPHSSAVQPERSSPRTLPVSGS